MLLDRILRRGTRRRLKELRDDALTTDPRSRSIIYVAFCYAH